MRQPLATPDGGGNEPPNGGFSHADTVATPVGDDSNLNSIRTTLGPNPGANGTSISGGNGVPDEVYRGSDSIRHVGPCLPIRNVSLVEESDEFTRNPTVAIS
jgi:hypothetical protein